MNKIQHIKAKDIEAELDVIRTYYANGPFSGVFDEAVQTINQLGIFGLRCWSIDKTLNKLANTYLLKFQMRIDTHHDYLFPICKCNDMSFVNANVAITWSGTPSYNTTTVSFDSCMQQTDDTWTTAAVYSIPKLTQNIIHQTVKRLCHMMMEANNAPIGE